MSCVLVALMPDMCHRRPLSYRFDLLLDLSLQRGIQIRQRGLVDDGELQSSTKIREQPPGLVFGNRRPTLMAEEARNGLLSEPRLLSRNPQSIDVLMSRSSHTAVLRIRKCAC